MTIIITSDLQLADGSRDAYRFNFFSWLRELAFERKADRCYILGDLTEEKDNHGAAFVNRVINEIVKLADICPVTILQGNHDYVAIDSPFFGFTNNLPNVSWISIPSPMGDVPGLGQTIMLPHSPDPEEEWPKFKLASYQTIFCHQTIGSVQAGKGPPLRGIDPKLLPAKARIFAGDVHVPMTIRNLTYVGAPYTVDFGDDYEGRVLLLNNGKVESVPVPGAQKRLLELQASPDGIDWTKADMGRIAQGDLLKIKLELSVRSLELYQECRKELTSWAADNALQLVTLTPTFPVAASISPGAKRAGERSHVQWIVHYAKTQKLGNDMLSYGLKVLKGE